MILTEIANYHLEKCYSINEIELVGKAHIVVAAEKVNKCLLFNQSGLLVDAIWEGPGGTMSIVPLPDKSGRFLASQKMYSPNDSEEAEIVLVERKQQGEWDVRSFMDIPFVHRFDILRSEDKLYFIGATIKSGHRFKDDWTSPGNVWGGLLDTDLHTPPQLTECLGGLTHNHGFCKRTYPYGEYVVVSADEGVFAIFPPTTQNKQWTSKQLLDTPVSDIGFIDFDGDGQDEMIAFSPFHGDQVSIYKLIDGHYQEVYRHPEPLEFIHAIWTGVVYGKPVAFIGHRKGPSRDLYAISWHDDGYHFDVMVKDIGSTNLYAYQVDGIQILVSANREIDQIAFYRIEA